MESLPEAEASLLRGTGAPAESAMGKTLQGIIWGSQSCSCWPDGRGCVFKG